MTEMKKYMESGILELYVLNQATPEERLEVERMAVLHEEIRIELDAISMALEQYASQYAVSPDPTIKPFLMATIDYMERLQNGEEPAFPPEIQEYSLVEDYATWLNREDLKLTEPLNEIHAKIIGYTPAMTTAIVWIEHGAPPETHTNEYEKFLIVEGTCNIIIDGIDHHLEPGNVLTIPLHLEHMVCITSSQPCKIILQRIAA